MRLNQIILLPYFIILVNNFLFSFSSLSNNLTSMSSVSSSRVSGGALISSFLNFDFNIGGGFGFYQTSSLSGNLENSFDMRDWNSFSINKFSHKNYSWTGGGFVGLGVSFDTNFPMAVGLEYKGEYLNSKKSLFFSLTSESGDYLTGKRVADLTGYKHSIDFYYKINFLQGKFPIGMQLLTGLSMFNPINSSLYELDSDKSKVVFDRNSYHSSSLGLGFHLGTRFYFHMIYLGVDYSYYSYSNKTVISSNTLFLSKNTVNFSVGIIFNPIILKAIM